MEAFWDVMPCSLLEVDQRFIGACWLHHQLKRWPVFTSLHGTAAQKAVIFSIVSLHHDCMNLLFIDKRDIEFDSSVLTFFIIWNFRFSAWWLWRWEPSGM